MRTTYHGQMNRFFKSLPLSAKLMLIGFFPMVLLALLVADLYREKNQDLELVETYRTRINQSATLSALTQCLQEERKFSFDHLITGNAFPNLPRVRRRTDSTMRELLMSTDPAVKDFPLYTNLDRLKWIRDSVDSKIIGTGGVMHYYSNSLFRLNTLNTLPTTTQDFLEPVHQDMVSQKLLSEMITYIGILRANVYNVLYTKKYPTETLLGSLGAYDVYRTYYPEFQIKSSSAVRDSFNKIVQQPPLRLTNAYLDKLFKTYTFDSTYKPEEWWDLSYQAVLQIRDLKTKMWRSADAELSAIHAKQKQELTVTLVLLLIALAAVVALTSYVSYIISRSLKELALAAQKLSSGVTDVGIRADSNDVIGSLANCIAEIDKNNKKLAVAAEAIGKGNFDTEVQPRSEDDVLGNAIAQMQKKLLRYRHKMESIVEQRTRELKRSNEDLQQFAHIASHDLKEPVRKIRTFSSRLVGETDKISDKGKQYIDKIQSASERMTGIIDGILSFSMVNAYEETFEKVDLNEIVEGIRNDLEMVIGQKSASIVTNDLPVVHGIPVLMHQLFYNLVSNALKFTSPDRKPVIEIKGSIPQLSDTEKDTKGQSVSSYRKIEVSDNGIGFSQDQADKMFDLFTRLNARDKFEGTGLGLALCKKIVERHNGFIYAEGKENQGAVFSIVLPAAQAGAGDDNQA